MRASLVVVFWVASALPAFALERTGTGAPETDGAWKRSGAVEFSYYNICTDAIWVWSGWDNGATVGVDFEIPAAGSACPDFYDFTLLASSRIYYTDTVPSGYGFTGTISATGGAACGGAIVATRPFLPPHNIYDEPDWYPTNWSDVEIGRDFRLLITFAAPSGFTSPIGICSDRPYGDGGPPPCGTCFPTTRSSRTRYFGVAGEYCPSGITLSDPSCDVELMMGATMNCGPAGSVAVESTSWASIKTLYR